MTTTPSKAESQGTAQPQSSAQPQTPLGASRSIVVQDFFTGAPELREEFERRFARRRGREPQSFVWDYWHVPGQYTYLRTHGDSYFSEPLTAALFDRLRAWGTEILGCGSIRPPWLSYYIDGCVQELHADVPHGPWAYVLSLTRWEERSFEGGETMLLRPTALDFWSGFDAEEPLEANDLVEQLPAGFNQLTVFDARIPHGVRMVQGTRDPLDSRVVLHGWFEYPKLTVSDGLQDQKSLVALKLVLAHINERLTAFDSLTGLLTVRLELERGRVAASRVLSDTLISTAGDAAAPREAVELVLAAVTDHQFPGGKEQDWAILPFRLK